MIIILVTKKSVYEYMDVRLKDKDPVYHESVMDEEIKQLNDNTVAAKAVYDEAINTDAPDKTKNMAFVDYDQSKRALAYTKEYVREKRNL